MAWLRDIGVTAKLRIGFIIAFVLIAAVGSVALLQLRTHNNFATILVESTLPEVVLLGSVDRQLAEYRALVQRRIETGDFGSLTQIDERLKAISAAIDGDLAAYAVVVDADEEREKFAHLKAQWTTLQSALADVLKDAETGVLSDGYKHFDAVFLAALDEARQDIVVLLDFAREEATTAAAHAHVLYRIFLGLLIAMLLLAAAGLGAALIWLSDSISRPIQRIGLAMRRLIAGDDSVVIAGDISRRDEIGTLVAAATSFRESLIRQRRLTQDAERERARLAAAIGNMSVGLSMYGADQRLIVCNERFRELYGLTSAQCRPGTALAEIVEHRIRNGRIFANHDPEAFRQRIFASTTRRDAFTIVNQLANGQIVRTAIQPMTEGGWVSVHDDLTARHAAELKIQSLTQEADVERQRLAAAMSNLPIGVVMFDADQRIIASNERYAAMYHLPAELVRPGATLEAILEHRARTGTLSSRDPQAHRAGLLRSIEGTQPIKELLRIRDGRVISVIHQPMIGGGWVSTHEDVTDRVEAEERIAHMARHDLLTDLPNRAVFRQRLEDELRRAGRDQTTAVLSLDLDHFKNVNESLGHAVGDRVLEIVADRLRACVRDVDTVARLSGDEFAIVLVDAEQPRGARALAQRIIESLEEPIAAGRHQTSISTTIGIALAPADGETSDSLLKNADAALQRAKSERRGSYRFFEQAMDRRMQERRVLELDLRRAIDEEQFTLVYQPQVNLDTGRVVGFEALVRWQHPVRGTVSPAEFIPVAEETGMIVPLGERVLRCACSDAARLPASVRVAVNLSAVQFRSARLMQTVVDALASAHLLPSRLELEITESALLEDSEVTLTVLHQLRELGVRISMDDFGTGHSSLGYLQRFPFDRIKIDRSFVANVNTERSSLAIIRAVTGLSESLDIGTTAEGVETQEQYDRIKAEGCTEAQGLFTGAPMTIEEAIALLDEDSARVSAA